MSKQLFAFIVGVIISSAWWNAGTQHWAYDLQFFPAGIATIIFAFIAVAWALDNWDK